MPSKTVLVLVLAIMVTIVVAQSAPSYSWNCPTTPIYGNSDVRSTSRLGGWVTTYITVCPQRQYYVYYSNDGTYRWVWLQLMRVYSVPNTASGWKHTTGGIVKDRTNPTQRARHVCASWYSIGDSYASWTPSTDCVYGPAVPGTTAPNSGEYNVGTVIRTVSFQISVQGKDQSGSLTTTLTAQWTENIPRIQVSADGTDPTSFIWNQYIYDGGDRSIGDTWGSMSWDWMYGLTVLAKPGAKFYLGVVGTASFWRCGFACLTIEYDMPIAAWFVAP
ncbi:hypothetical protein CGL51_00030 [Pyrobaculum aerophilum]|uniref:Conserved within P. aerophilum n=3 Tax=Pyrobaculum aerophilum TaxID=13773 RepID=Q8ZXY1_PYRAE|nr:conserved within P. aerophilum [Pyrobaculum aerophilum str. IM2]RFA96825.1 hypothetical protein CGL52_10370 [Pyrobaculum aerophilum]RFA98473.1 hypothetical protein CGL51_00030 [Pyrobaculum aerophilum]